MYQDLRTRQQVFTDILAVTREWPVRLTIPGRTGATTLDNVPTAFVTTNYFDVLLVRPLVGRFFVEQDDRHPQSAEAEGSVAIISDGLWERQFARDPDVVGRVIQVNNSACRVIGVAPSGFVGESLGVAVDVWVPVISFSPRNYLDARGGQFTQIHRTVEARYHRNAGAECDDAPLPGSASGRVEHVSPDASSNNPRGGGHSRHTGLHWS